MASNIDDRWLWLGLGVFTFVAITRVSAGLHQVRTLTEISTPIIPPLGPRTVHSPSSTHQEDAIKTSSLLVLATSQNTELRLSATKILCSRFYASQKLRKHLVRDLNSKDPDTRHRAQLAFNLLCENGVVREYSALKALESERDTVEGELRALEDEMRGVEQERDAVERELRRRRREAMVISEGGGPFTQEDVFMRDDGAGGTNSW
ncbi:hypothetical protein P153DRAFT_333367 [Dothidotthia symphoricarpi CBS 119687]|uniref:Uncharacterized protein n=1 Tax=Dothidotthia symphoricarpi CBS 119687 TaxID=1392245 RepID=A0A6A6APH7_9PLEO|nr:uncharacterized protein P153DRAFT_333367 [Dothidotthia symphoricarpi CBS 119687]KAF2132787.1 hypothetical protein P153DRAFT_333367 [Dothidotthia symphoricarpi CBS 119687]